MSERGGRRHIRKAWRQQRRWLRDNPRVPMIVFGTVALAAVPMLSVPFGVAMFELGVVVTAALAALWWLSMVATGGYRLYVGAMGEDFTSESLRALRKRGWRHLDSVQWDGFDVDHVAIGPGGILAIETKWTDQAWDVNAPVIAPYLRRAIDQAATGAKRISSYLRSSDAQLDIPVLPVLVLWGPSVADTDGGSRSIDGVAVLIGRQHAEWQRDLGGRHIDEWQLDAAVHALEAYQDRHAAHVSGRT
jgi:hypothetical protein